MLNANIPPPTKKLMRNHNVTFFIVAHARVLVGHSGQEVRERCNAKLRHRHSEIFQYGVRIHFHPQLKLTVRLLCIPDEKVNLFWVRNPLINHMFVGKNQNPKILKKISTYKELQLLPFPGNQHVLSGPCNWKGGFCRVQCCHKLQLVLPSCDGLIRRFTN